MNRTIAIQGFFFFLVISQVPATDLAHSTRVQKLLRRLQAAISTYGKSRQNSFKTTEIRQFQGSTNYTEDGRIEIHVPPPVSADYDDAVMAHELMHVILNARGFAGVIINGQFERYFAPNVMLLFGPAYTPAAK